jgi:hypothetical protein
MMPTTKYLCSFWINSNKRNENCKETYSITKRDTQN